MNRPGLAGGVLEPSSAPPAGSEEVVVEGARSPTTVHFDQRDQLDDWVADITALNSLIAEKLDRGWDPILVTGVESGGSPTAEFRVRDVVGWITAAGQSHCILPKFMEEEVGVGHTHSEFMARYLAFSLSSRYGLLESYTGEEAHPQFADLFAAAFLDAMEPALRTGLAYGYEESKVYSNRISGRVIPEEYGVSVYQRPELVPQVVDRFQRDIPLNRLLGWTVRTLLSLPLSAKHVGRLIRLEEMFAGVPGLVPPWRVVQELSLTPAQAEYTDAVELAKVLYRGSLTTPADGDLRAANFVFLGWHVFQEFFGTLLLKLERRRKDVSSSRGKLTLAVSEDRDFRDVECYPDFRIEWSGRRLLLDTKYKVGGQEPSAEDASQVIAAGIAYDADAVVLVYPSIRGGESEGPHRWTLRRGDVSLPLYRLDVDPHCVKQGNTPDREVERIDNAVQDILFEM